jgi:hypothetical protein
MKAFKVNERIIRRVQQTQVKRKKESDEHAKVTVQMSKTAKSQ